MTEPHTERHWHWEFLAFDSEHDEPTEVRWAVTVNVIGYLCEADARIAVQDIVQRQHYKLKRVFECPSCGYQGQIVKAMNAVADGMR